MNITEKIIITDTNIITDLDNAGILEEFITIKNVYISDLIKTDELNQKTGNLNTIKKAKVISATEKQVLEAVNLSLINKKLSMYDLLNYVLARDNDCILATGDNRLKQYAELNDVEVIRTLKIIKLMTMCSIISKEVAIISCQKLKENPRTRIPISSIEQVITSLTKDLTSIS